MTAVSINPDSTTTGSTPADSSRSYSGNAAGGGPKFAVIRFPGSNCDQDAYHVIKEVLNKQVDYVWHQETSLKGYDVIILPGGFSY